MAQEVETLIEMGFTRSKAERALAVTNNKGVEPAMEWLLAHADEPDPVGGREAAEGSSSCSDASPTLPTSTQEAASSSQETQEASDPGVARSLLCEDCGKLFRSQQEVEYHAAKTNHANFSESTEEKKPLTEEEKKEQLAKLEERMKQKRKEREEKEKEEALERERIRIKSGKDMQDAKQRMQDMEMMKLVEQRRRDKLEDQQARERVRKQIQADKEARRLVAQGGNPEPPPPPAPAPAPVAAAAPAVSTATSARLQLRLPDGRAVTQTFGAREQLSAVRLYLQINEMQDKPFGLMTSFPRRVFNEEDYEMPLDVLGLTPSAVVIVSKGQ